MLRNIYLDNNATTRIDPRVVEAMYQVHKQRLANPASQHRDGRMARSLLERAREEIMLSLDCRLSGMDSDQLIFTSGGTEANNLAIAGLAPQTTPGQSFGPSTNSMALKSSGPRPISKCDDAAKEPISIISSIEHPSVLAKSDALAMSGHPRWLIPATDQGIIDIESFSLRLQSLPSDSVSLVSIMLANNETGVLQPVDQVIALCRQYQRNAVIHTDAVQAFGKVPVSFQQLDVDAMTVTAHKMHGPVGIGALVMKSHMKLQPQLLGGAQQLGLRPGTESISLAVGFATASTLATKEIHDRSNRMNRQRCLLEAGILKGFNERIAHVENHHSVQGYAPVIIGANAHRLPHTTCIAFPGLDRQTLQLALDRAGISVSTGSACTSGSAQPSHVLTAMGLAPSVFQSAIRISIDYETTESDIEVAIPIILDVAWKLIQQKIQRS